jgi:L-aspartate oxidase
MRRYLTDFSLKNMQVTDSDVLIVGSGIAGLYASLNIAPDKKSTLITKVDIQNSNSWLAQGGIAAVISPTDNIESHIEDTLYAGAGLCDPEAVRVLVTEGPENIRALIDLNVPFDTNPEGELEITREGGHSCRRIVHCGGDATGRETTKRLGQIVMSRPNITPMFRTYLIDLITTDGKISGALVMQDGVISVIRCPSVIIATGGVGYIYKYSTNPRGASGDGIAAAVRAGAKTKLMEMIQFHPTTLISQEHSDRLFLISEAVRGEGGILRNSRGIRFMESYHPMKDLAPRDVVTRGILQDLQRSGEKNVFLDVSALNEDFFRHRFPTIYSKCHEYNIDVPRQSIPVRPGQHYTMGGIDTDVWGQTCIPGLYACGEAACTGIHGANRLASNSMLECLVFGRRAARHINEANREKESSLDKLEISSSAKSDCFSNLDVNALKDELRCTMSKYVGAIRTPNGLEKAKQIIGGIFSKIENSRIYNTDEYELYNMCQVALDVISSAIDRKESVGAHYIVND